MTPGTFTVSRVELKKVLSSLGVSDGVTEGLLSAMDKTHKHVNVITFVDMLQKIGLKQYDINNILRRVGLDDTSIAEVFNVLDEQRIQNTFGKIVKLVVE